MTRFLKLEIFKRMNIETFITEMIFLSKIRTKAVSMFNTLDR